MTTSTPVDTAEVQTAHATGNQPPSVTAEASLSLTPDELLRGKELKGR